MGLLLLDAISQRDYPIITGVALVIGLSVMLINLAVDLSYGLAPSDALYLQLALDVGGSLATFDHEVAEAATREGVALEPLA